MIKPWHQHHIAIYGISYLVPFLLRVLYLVHILFSKSLAFFVYRLPALIPDEFEQDYCKRSPRRSEPGAPFLHCKWKCHSSSNWQGPQMKVNLINPLLGTAICALQQRSTELWPSWPRLSILKQDNCKFQTITCHCFDIPEVCMSSQHHSHGIFLLLPLIKFFVTAKV